MAAVTEVLINGGSSKEVIDEAVGMIYCALLSLSVGLLMTFIIGIISSSYSKHLREMEFNRVQEFSLEEMNRFNTYSLITRSTNDVKQIQDFIGIGLESMMRAPIISVWALIKISGSNLSWTATTAVAVAAMLLVVLCILRKTIPGFKKVQKLTDRVNRASSELLDGIRVIRAYNAEDYESNRFSEANDDLLDNNLVVYRAMSYNVPLNSFIRNGLTMSIYWMGAMIIAGTTDYGMRLQFFSDMIVFSTYAVMVLNGFRIMTQLFNLIPRASVSSERINEVIDTVPSIVSGPLTDLGTDDIVLSFKDVSFRYPGSSTDALSGVSFDVRKGSTVSIIGATGSGKTTLVNLIPRFYDPSSGSIYLYGNDMKSLNIDSLRERIGFVPQSNSMISGTVRENITYGSEPGKRTDEDVEQALRTSMASGFVADLGGLDYMIVEQGRNLSGGQKQRIAIARAICRKPELYIFDDSFSALDFRTDRMIRSALDEQTRDSTRLIVAQRIGTVMDSDMIVVLEHGRVVGKGTHDELMSTCPVYRDIADSQFGEDG